MPLTNYDTMSSGTLGAVKNALDNLSPTAATILADVLTAMQYAEEMGGPVGDDYLRLMKAIAAEATRRHDIYTEVLGGPAAPISK